MEQAVVAPDTGLFGFKWSTVIKKNVYCIPSPIEVMFGLMRHYERQVDN